MTCVAGIVHRGTVSIGVDSAAVQGWTRRASRLAKVFRRGPFLIGYTTSFRMGQLLEHHLAPPAQEPGQEDMAFMVTQFIEKVRVHGAYVGDLYMSLIHAAELNGVAPFPWLVALMRHAADVARDSTAWLPWNYPADASPR